MAEPDAETIAKALKVYEKNRASLDKRNAWLKTEEGRAYNVAKGMRWYEKNKESVLARMKAKRMAPPAQPPPAEPPPAPEPAPAPAPEVIPEPVVEPVVESVVEPPAPPPPAPKPVQRALSPFTGQYINIYQGDPKYPKLKRPEINRPPSRSATPAKVFGMA